jgi:SAM-dependent methyltransferase
MESVLPMPPASILDVGCGNGQYVDWFSRKGYQATGIDSSTGMVRQAQQDYQGTFFSLGFDQLDQLDRRFECVYCIGNSLSYLPQAQMDLFFRKSQALLDPSGSFVLQLVNWDHFQQKNTLSFPSISLEDETVFHRSYQRIDAFSVVFLTSITANEEVIHRWEDILFIHSTQTLLAGLNSAGFEQITLYGDFQQTPFDPNSSPAAILQAKRPG